MGKKQKGGHFLLSPAARDFTLEFVEKMSAATVHAFFVRNRWGDDGTQVCPECGSIDKHYWIKTRRQWRCRDVACGRMFSVTTGTKWADHKMPLKTILRGMVLFATVASWIAGIRHSHAVVRPRSTARFVGRSVGIAMLAFLLFLVSIFVATIFGGAMSKNHDFAIGFLLVVVSLVAAILGSRWTWPTAPVRTDRQRLVRIMLWLGGVVLTLAAGAELATNG